MLPSAVGVGDATARRARCGTCNAPKAMSVFVLSAWELADMGILQMGTSCAWRRPGIVFGLKNCILICYLCILSVLCLGMLVFPYSILRIRYFSLTLRCQNQKSPSCPQ